MGQIKAFIFDNAGVVGIPTTNISLHELADRIGLDYDHVKGAYFGLSDRSWAGEITEDRFWNEFAKKIGIKYGRELKKEMYARHLYHTGRKGQNKKVVAVVKALKQKGYTVALLTNALPFHSKVDVKLGHYSHFDKVFVSYKLGMRKPQARIFRHCLKALKLKPGECIFIDDNLVNVNGARQVGIKSIHFKNAGQLERQLRPYLR